MARKKKAPVKTQMELDLDALKVVGSKLGGKLVAELKKSKVAKSVVAGIKVPYAAYKENKYVADQLNAYKKKHGISMFKGALQLGDDKSQLSYLKRKYTQDYRSRKKK